MSKRTNEDHVDDEKKHLNKKTRNEAMLKNPVTVGYDMFADDEDAPESVNKPDFFRAESEDHQGYYLMTFGEVINGKYKVVSQLGKGVFSSVLKANDTNNVEFALKIMRKNDLMFRAGMREADLLRRLREGNMSDDMCVIRMIESFEWKSHFCIVFELLEMNLRELLGQYGRSVGLSIKAVRAYAHQLLKSLALLKKCRIVHADIKPDNILVQKEKSRVKLSDFGAGCLASQRDLTPYVASRFYRAPEIILGIPATYQIDMWAVGCSLYELYTGQVLFTGISNNDMLYQIMLKRGPFPHKLLKKGIYSTQHFDLENHCEFLRTVHEDGVLTKKRVVITERKEIKSIIYENAEIPEKERELTDRFCDLLEKMLSLNLEKRITPLEALEHKFFS